MTKFGKLAWVGCFILAACGGKKENTSEDLFTVPTNRSANAGTIYGVWESTDFGVVSGKLRIKITDSRFSYSLSCQNIKNPSGAAWTLNGGVGATIAGQMISYADRVRERPPTSDYDADCKVRLKDAYNETFSLSGGKLLFTYEFGNFSKISD